MGTTRGFGSSARALAMLGWASLGPAFAACGSDGASQKDADGQSEGAEDAESESLGDSGDASTGPDLPPDGGGATTLDPAPCGAAEPCPAGRRCDLSDGICVPADALPAPGAACVVGSGDECAWGHQCVGGSCKKVQFLAACETPPVLEVLDASLPEAGGEAHAVDLDGDGRPELVELTESLSILWGDGRTPTWTDWVGPQARSAFGDLDGDLRADLLTARDPEGESALVLSRYRGDGAGAFESWGETSPFTNPPGDGPMRLADLDGDGELDLVSIASGLHVSPGLGQGEFGTPVPISAPVGASAAVPTSIEVVERDAASELLIGWKTVDGAGLTSRWLSGAPLPTLIVDDRGDASAFALAVRGDADAPDLLHIGSRGGWTSVGIHPGSSDWLTGVQHFALDLPFSTLAVSDVDGDGRADLVLGNVGSDAALGVVFDLFGSQRCWSAYAAPEAGPSRGVLVFDVGADDREELLWRGNGLRVIREAREDD